MEKGQGCQKSPVVFPFLIEEPKGSSQDAINQSFLNGIMSKWPDKQQSRFAKDAFPPNKNVLSSQGRERGLKGFHGTSQKDIPKNYSCPNIVDMSSIIFYHHDRARQDRPKRIFNGFFPNKVRSAHGCLVNDGANQNRSRNAGQVGMYLGKARKDSTNLTGLRGNQEPHSNSRTSFLHGPKSTNKHSEESLDVRRTHSCWPVRNGSPSPWLQRYKLKKRATTSYALEKPAEDCREGSVHIPKRNQEYVNLSNAVIWDAF